MIRPLGLDDLGAALGIQGEVYLPAIQDGEAAFASRITAAPDWCWAAADDGRLAAYLISHPWPSMRPPAPDTVLDKASGDVWYIHDLSVAPWARGQRLGDQLLTVCLGAHPEIRRSELVAVPGAAPFWERRGWSAVASKEMQSKAASYGDGSLYLFREWP